MIESSFSFLSIRVSYYREVDDSYVCLFFVYNYIDFPFCVRKWIFELGISKSFESRTFNRSLVQIYIHEKFIQTFVLSVIYLGSK